MFLVKKKIRDYVLDGIHLDLGMPYSSRTRIHLDLGTPYSSRTRIRLDLGMSYSSHSLRPLLAMA